MNFKITADLPQVRLPQPSAEGFAMAKQGSGFRFAEQNEKESCLCEDLREAISN
jgi:hypothetical protein